MEEITNFGTKNSTTLPSLANKNLNNLRDENVELIYAFTDPFMRNFACNSVKAARCNAFIQYFTSTFSDDVLNIIAIELNVNSNLCYLL